MKGSVALITGGTSGIGRVSADMFAKRGARVVLTGRREADGQEAVRRIQASGGEAHFVKGDVSLEADVRRMVEETVSRFGRLDYAFNNAGIEGEVARPITEARMQNFRTVFDINVLGVMLSMKHQIPAMLANGGGAIVNNASVAGRIGMPGMSVYAASKHAVLGLTRCAALEFARQGVRINAVSPAAIQTDMSDRLVDTLGGAPARDYLTSLHPIGRIGTPEEVAKAVLFLCSDEASFITGHDLLIDGALTVP
ncbi:MAG: SDR family oxidoreductase [Phycisphaerae bacterium]|nr:SDR family oxidoreductase [Phycisphaerae bacterium]